MADFRYDNSNDAQQQLDGCVMLTDDDRVVHLEYAGRWDYDVNDLMLYENEVHDIRELGLSFAPLELGYINSRYGLAYVVRNPIRMWKAGIAYDNIKALRGSIDDGVFATDAMAKCILNVYPDMKHCYLEAKYNYKELAFHKDFAFNAQNIPTVGVEYKGVEIGFINEDENFEIDEKFFYVRELLEEILSGKG